MFLFLNWNVVIALALVFTDGSENSNRQVVLLDDFRKGTLPKSNRLETFVASSKRKCALRCLKNSECSSFTFCENKSCQLNSIDAFEDRVQLIPDAGCHYNGKQGGSKRQDGLSTEGPENTTGGNFVSPTGDTTTQTAPLQTTSSYCIPTRSTLDGSLCVVNVNNSLEHYLAESLVFLAIRPFLFREKQCRIVSLDMIVS